MSAVPGLVLTGATGRVGGRVARRVVARSTPARLLVRDPSRAPDLPHAEVVRAAYSDRAAATAALTGARTLFMVSAEESPDRVVVHRTFIDAAVAAGIRHIVYLSFISAAADSVFTLGRDHWETEQYIRATGVDFTLLRDNLYADFVPALVDDDGVIRGPADDGRVAAVALDDVAAAAAEVLADPTNHVGASYGLTGSTAHSLAEVAEILTRATGRPTTFHNETVEEAYASRSSYGVPQWQLDAWVSTYTGMAAGEYALVTDDVRRLTGRAPLALEQILRAGAARSS